ncbi:MAG: CRISPR-associated endonuclease Cas1 [Candidatus Aminicenantes bacterium]|nr:CRISPR-associated endonuclease Cas1 [Candidatus Aminicenantes bacterium]
MNEDILKEFPSSLGQLKPAFQINLFTREAEPIPCEIEIGSIQNEETYLSEGISLVKTEDSSQVIISGYGIFLGKKSERLVIRQDDKAIYEIPLFRINEVVVVSKGVSLSSDLIHELCQRGIKLSFLNRNGQPFAMISSPLLTATIISRREQIKAFDDRRGLEFAKIIVRGKIKNQESLLRYFGKYMKQSSPDKFRKVWEIANKLRLLRHKVDSVDGTNIAEARDTLYGIEGHSGKLYWSGVKEIIGGRVEFFGRVHQGAIDVVNMLLNYGYGILYSVVWGAVLNAGLEPFAGFLHTDRPGKPSLVLDLVEEFRQPIVDRVVISHINLGQAIRIKDGLLDPDTRKIIGSKILERLESTTTFQNKTYKLRSIIQIQARNLASFLRGESSYNTFSFKW